MAVESVPNTVMGCFLLIVSGMATLIGYLIKRVFDKTIPDLMVQNEAQRMMDEKIQKEQREAFQAEQARLRESTAKNIAELTKAYQEEGKAERAQCAAQFKETHGALLAVTTALSAERAAAVAAINEHTTNQMVAYRHDLYDQINAAVLGREVAQARKDQRDAVIQAQAKKEQ